MEKICFTTVCDKNYINHAAGLIYNLNKLHKNLKILVCCLDDDSYQIFNNIDSKFNIKTIAAKEIWGDEKWNNLELRLNKKEIAFATTSAIPFWALNNFTEKIVYLDSDIYLLKNLDDFILELEKYALILVPNGRPLNDIKRTPKTGLFCTGTIGFSQKGKKYADHWRKLCFDQCRELLEDNLYFDQKYLDIFACQPEVLIYPDPGIQVIGNHMNYHQPYKDSKNIWRIKQLESEITIFHMTRDTNKDFELSKEKNSLNQKAFDEFNIDLLSVNLLTKKEKVSSTTNKGKIFFLFRNIILKSITNILHNTYNLHRIFSLKKGNYKKRLGAFKRKEDILKKW
tara:strand:+ start:1807 stop:2829 length:1023 start_codon:yes stop_codon:yes gene_type:complete